MKNKKWVLVLLAVFAAVCLAGCEMGGPKEDPNAEQYNEYVMGLLDANFHGEYEAYMQMTGAGREDAEARYENAVNTLADSLKEYFLIDTNDAEIRDTLKEIAKELYLKSNYTAEEAILDEKTGRYSVNVRIDPLTFFTDVAPEVESYVSDMNTRVMNREFAEMSEADYEKQYAQGLVEILKNHVSSLRYGDAVTVNLVFTFDEANQSTYVTDEELAKVTARLLEN
ncbi:MAG: YlaF family protein [Lachnospiraceae bacterium]|nr:YlaF family protein [Lachnospiraceae bacterium]